MAKIILPLILMLTLCSSVYSQGKFAPTDEYLEYNVSWNFVNLGKIRVWTNANADFIKSRVAIDSDPLIFFANVHFIFESEFRDDSLLNDPFTAYETRGGDSIATVFRSVKGKIQAVRKDLKTNRILERVETPVSTPYYNGITAFFLTRRFAGRNEDLSEPFLFSSKSDNRENDTPSFKIQIERVDLHFTGKKTHVEVSSLDSEVNALEFSGYVHFVSKEIVGVSGEFTGWYSDDQARVPLKSTFNTFLGDVTLKLVKWKKENWNPPVVNVNRHPNTKEY